MPIQYLYSTTVEGCQAGGLGHRLQYMREYNAESKKQGRKRFNSIVKTIHFSYLPIIYLCSNGSDVRVGFWLVKLKVSSQIPFSWTTNP